MKNPTLTGIRKSVESQGGEYKKAKAYLCGAQAYEINGVLMTKSMMVEQYQRGGL